MPTVFQIISFVILSVIGAICMGYTSYRDGWRKGRIAYRDSLIKRVKSSDSFPNELVILILEEMKDDEKE